MKFSRDPTGRRVIELGPGLRFFTPEYFADTLGESVPTILSWVRSLSVPVWVFHQHTYIWYEGLLLAQTCALQPGKPDFVTGNGVPPPDSTSPRTSLPPSEFAAERDSVVPTLISTIRSRGYRTTRQLERELKSVHADLTSQNSLLHSLTHARPNPNTTAPAGNVALGTGEPTPPKL